MNKKSELDKTVRMQITIPKGLRREIESDQVNKSRYIVHLIKDDIDHRTDTRIKIGATQMDIKKRLDDIGKSIEKIENLNMLGKILTLIDSVLEFIERRILS